MELSSVSQSYLPQESIVVRGVKVARLKSAKALGSNEELLFIRRTAIHEVEMPDPDGEIIIDVRGNKVCGLMPVIVLDFGGNPSAYESSAITVKFHVVKRTNLR